MDFNFTDTPVFTDEEEPETEETTQPSGLVFSDQPGGFTDKPPKEPEKRPDPYGTDVYRAMGELAPGMGMGALEGVTTEFPALIGKGLKWIGGLAAEEQTKTPKAVAPVLGLGKIAEVVKIPEVAAGKALEFVGGHIQKFFEKKAEEWYGPEAERAPKDPIAKMIHEGSKMLGPSLIPGVGQIKALQAIGGLQKLLRAAKAAEKTGDTVKATQLFNKANEVAKASVELASALTAAEFGASQGEDTRSQAEQLARVLEMQGFPEDAEKIRTRGKYVSLGTAAIEALGEFLGTKYLAQALRLDEGRIVKMGIKSATARLLKTLGVEVGTEWGQQFGEAGVEKIAGVRPTADPWEEAKDVIGPSAWLTLITFGAGSVHAKMAGTGPIKLSDEDYARWKELQANPLITQDELEQELARMQGTAIEAERSTIKPSSDIFTGLRDVVQEAVDTTAQKLVTGEPIRFQDVPDTRTIAAESKERNDQIRKSEEEHERAREQGLLKDLPQVSTGQRFNAGLGLSQKKQADEQAMVQRQEEAQVRQKIEEYNAARAQAQREQEMRAKAQEEAQRAAKAQAEAQAAEQERVRFTEAIATEAGLYDEGNKLLTPFEMGGTSEQKKVLGSVRDIHKALSTGVENADKLKALRYEALQHVDLAGQIDPRFPQLINRLVHKVDNKITAIHLKEVQEARQKAKEAAKKAQETGKKAPTQAQAETLTPKAEVAIPAPEAGQKATEAPFNTATTEMPMYDQLLKAGEAKVVNMSPEEYLEKAAQVKGVPRSRDQELTDMNLARDYARRMVAGEKAPMPVLDLVERTQEGKHRAEAAKMINVASIPVLVRGEFTEVEEMTKEPKKFDFQDVTDRAALAKLGYTEDQIGVAERVAWQAKSTRPKKGHRMGELPEPMKEVPGAISVEKLRETIEKERTAKEKALKEAEAAKAQPKVQPQEEKITDRAMKLKDGTVVSGKSVTGKPVALHAELYGAMTPEQQESIQTEGFLNEKGEFLDRKQAAHLTEKEIPKQKPKTKKEKKEELKAKQMALFDRKEGIVTVPIAELAVHTQAIKLGFQKARINLAKVVKINVLPTSRDLKEVNHRLYMQMVEHKAHDQVQGVFDPATREIYIFANTNPTIIEAKRAAWHEMGHLSLHDLMGRDLEPLLDRVRSKYMKESTEYLQTYGITDNRPNRLIANEEVLIGKFLKNEDPTIMERFRALIQKFTRHIGFSDAITDSDVKALLNAMRVNLIEDRKTEVAVPALHMTPGENGGDMARFLRVKYPATWEDTLVKAVNKARKRLETGDLDEGSPAYKKMLINLGSYLQGRTIRHQPGTRFLVAGKTLYGAIKPTDKQVTKLQQNLYGPVEITYYEDQYGNQIVPGPVFSEDAVERGRQMDEIVKRRTAEAEWYENWNTWMRQFEKAGVSDETITKYIKIQAILSAGLGPQENQRVFARVINALEAGRLRPGKKAPEASPQFSLFKKAEETKEAEPGGTGISEPDFRKVMEIWEGRDSYTTLEARQKAYGMKVGAYMTAGLFPKNKGAVVIDRHMPRPWGYSITWSPNMFEGQVAFDVHPEIQAEITKDIQDCAKRTGLTPAGVQAALWYEIRRPDLDAASYNEAAQLGKDYLPESLWNLLAIEGQNAVHYSDKILNTVKGSGLKEDHNSYSRKEITARKNNHTTQWPYIPLGQFYMAGEKPEPQLAGKSPHVYKVQPGTIYNGATDLLGLWNKAYRINAANMNTHPVNIFAKLVRDLKYKGFSYSGPSGETWMAIFGEQPVQSSVSVTASVSEVVDKTNNLPQDLSELNDIAQDRTKGMIREIKHQLAKRYSEVRVRAERQGLAQFDAETSGKMEYSLDLHLDGPIDSIRAALSDIIGLGKHQNSILLRGSPAVMGKSENGVTLQFKIKKGTTLSEIQAGLQEAKVNDYHLIPREGMETLFDLFLENKPSENVKKFMDKFGEPGTVTFYAETAEILDKSNYKEHIVNHFGATKGEKIYGKSKTAGEVYALTGGQRDFNNELPGKGLERPAGGEAGRRAGGVFPAAEGRYARIPVTFSTAKEEQFTEEMRARVKILPIEEKTAQDVVQRISRVMKNHPQFILYETVEDVPDTWRKAWPVHTPADAKSVMGFVHGKWHGQEAVIGLIRTNIKSEAKLVETIFHELIGHWGIRNVYTDKMEIERFFTDVFNERLASNREYLDKLTKAYHFDLTSASDQARIAEEWFARQAEQKSILRDSWLKEKMDKLTIMYQKFARALGMKVPLSSADIRQAIRESAASIIYEGKTIMDLIGERPTKEMLEERKPTLSKVRDQLIATRPAEEVEAVHDFLAWNVNSALMNSMVGEDPRFFRGPRRNIAYLNSKQYARDFKAGLVGKIETKEEKEARQAWREKETKIISQVRDENPPPSANMTFFKKPKAEQDKLMNEWRQGLHEKTRKALDTELENVPRFARKEIPRAQEEWAEFRKKNPGFVKDAVTDWKFNWEQKDPLQFMARKLKQDEPALYHETVQRLEALYDDELRDMVEEFRASPDGEQSWVVAPKAQVIKIWTEYAEEGYLSERSGKQMDRITHRTVKNIIRLAINKDLQGSGMAGNDFHRIILPEIYGIEGFDGQEKNDFENFMDTGLEDQVFEGPATRTSDFGIDIHDAVALLGAKTPEAQLTMVDLILNRVHERYDLAVNFIEGGVETLDQLAGKSEHMTLEEQVASFQPDRPEYRTMGRWTEEQTDRENAMRYTGGIGTAPDKPMRGVTREIKLPNTVPVVAAPQKEAVAIRALKKIFAQEKKQLELAFGKFTEEDMISNDPDTISQSRWEQRERELLIGPDEQEEPAGEPRFMYSPDEIHQHIGVKPGSNKQVNGLKMTFFQKAITQVFDSQLPRKILEGGNIPAEQSGYKSTNMMSNLPSIMHAIMYEGRPKFEDNWVVTPPEKAGGLYDVYSRLGDQANDFFLWQTAKSAQELRNSGRGNEHLFGIDQNTGDYLDDQEMINSIMGTVQPLYQGNKAEWDAAETRLREINKSILDFAEKAGIINAEMRETWERYNYIPFNRVLPEDIWEGDIESLFPRNPSAHVGTVFKLEGSKLNIGDPLMNLSDTYTYLMQQSLKNLSNIKTLALAQQVGLLDKSYPTPGKIKKGEISVRVDGKAQYYRVLDPWLYDALIEMDSMTNGAMTGWTKRLLANPKLWLTWGVTVAPAFRFANFIRDTITTAAMQKSFIGMTRAARGLWGSLVRSEDFKLFASTGGAFTGAYHSRDIRANTAEGIEKLKREILETNKPFFSWNPITMSKHLLDLWNRIGEASENANRLGVFMDLKKKGATTIEAAYQAKDLLDFHRSGKYGALRYLTQMVPFLNARLQGLYKGGRAAYEQDTAVNFWLHGMGLIAVSMLLYFHNKDDDRYKSLTDADKLMYWHIFDVPGLGHVRIPNPFELGVIFCAIPAVMSEVLAGDREWNDAMRFMVRAGENIYSFNPLPQLPKLAVEQWANKQSFTGQPIVPSGEERLAPEEQYGPQTSKTLREVGKVIQVSPRRLQTAVEGLFAYGGMFVLGMVDHVLEAVKHYPADPQDRVSDYYLTGYGRFVKGNTPSQYIKEQEIFYDYLNECETAFSTYRHFQRIRDYDAAREWRKENKIPIQTRKTLTAAQEQVNHINQKIKIVYASEKMTPEEKRTEIDNLLQKRGDIFKRAVKRYTERLKERQSREEENAD